MFLELIATFAAGFAGAGVVLLLNVITRGRLPRWAMPVGAGAAMIATAIASEYSWGARTVAGLPEGIVVVEEITQSRWWKPWTYAAPQTVRLIAVDPASAQTRDDVQGVQLVDLYLFARWQPPAVAPQFIRCADNARADVTPNTLQNPDAATWWPATDRLIAETCKETADVES